MVVVLVLCSGFAFWHGKDAAQVLGLLAFSLLAVFVVAVYLATNLTSLISTLDSRNEDQQTSAKAAKADTSSDIANLVP